MKGDAEKFLEYAYRIRHEARKFEFMSSIRLERAKDGKRWLRLEQIASKRFLLKIIRMLESFEV